jgi:hypothetical protein
MGEMKRSDTDLEAYALWKPQEEALLGVYHAAMRAQHQYRLSGNPLDLQDFANYVCTLFNFCIDDYEHDKKLKEKYPNLEVMKKYRMALPRAGSLSPDDWAQHFADVRAVLYTLNILRLTRIKNDDNDFAGIPGMDAAFRKLQKTLDDGRK